MLDALRAKYSAVAGLRALLLSTGDKVGMERNDHLPTLERPH